jgi:hypothetical protein
MHLEDTAIRYCCNVALENSISWKLLSAQQGYLKTPRYPCLAHTQDVRKYNCIVKRPHWPYNNFVVRCDYSSPGRTGSTSTLLCAASTRLPAAAALHGLRRTPPRLRLLGVRLLNYSPRLVNLSRAATTSSTTSRIHLRLVNFSNNCRGSITDRHGFADTRPRIKLSHLFQ